MARSEYHKKKVKKAITGWVIAVVVLAAFTFAVIGITNAVDNKVAEKYNTPLSALEYENVQKMSYTYYGTQYDFSFDGSKWIYDQDPQMPLAQDFMEYAVYYVTNMTADSKVAKNLDALEDYGLAEPHTTVTLKDKTGAEEIFYVSGEANENSSYYLYKEGDQTVYTTSYYFWYYFGYPINSLAEVEELEEFSADVNPSITVVSKDGTKQLSAGSDEANAFIEAVGSDLYFVQWSDYKTDETTKLCGLDSPTYTLQYTAAGNATTVLVGTVIEDGYYFATTPESQYVYAISGTVVDAMAALFE